VEQEIGEKALGYISRQLRDEPDRVPPPAQKKASTAQSREETPKRGVGGNNAAATESGKNFSPTIITLMRKSVARKI
jgi:hypothetical protein